MTALRGGTAIAAFFLLTYLVSWTLWAAAVAVGGRSGFPSSTVGGSFFLLGVFVPGLVAIALTAHRGGWPAIESLLSQAFKTSVGVRWYVFAAGYLMTIKLIAATVYRLATGAWPAFGQEPLYVMAIATLFSTPVQAGEEIGWRGYALPRLAERFGLGGASILLGALWACWHLPIFFMRGAGEYGQSFIVYFLGVIAVSVAMTWLYWRAGGSLLLTMLMHAAINNTKDIVPSAAAPASTPFGLNTSRIGLLTLLLVWICAIYFIVRMRGGTLNAQSNGVEIASPSPGVVDRPAGNVHS